MNPENLYGRLIGTPNICAACSVPNGVNDWDGDQTAVRHTAAGLRPVCESCASASDTMVAYEVEGSVTDTWYTIREVEP